MKKIMQYLGKNTIMAISIVITVVLLGLSACSADDSSSIDCSAQELESSFVQGGDAPIEQALEIQDTNEVIAQGDYTPVEQALETQDTNEAVDLLALQEWLSFDEAQYRKRERLGGLPGPSTRIYVKRGDLFARVPRMRYYRSSVEGVIAPLDVNYLRLMDGDRLVVVGSLNVHLYRTEFRHYTAVVPSGRPGQFSVPTLRVSSPTNAGWRLGIGNILTGSKMRVLWNC